VVPPDFLSQPVLSLRRRGGRRMIRVLWCVGTLIPPTIGPPRLIHMTVRRFAVDYILLMVLA
jgi:hypothetical protein